MVAKWSSINPDSPKNILQAFWLACDAWKPASQAWNNLAEIYFIPNNAELLKSVFVRIIMKLLSAGTVNGCTILVFVTAWVANR